MARKKAAYTTQLTVRLTDDENKEIRHEAARYGIPVADYIRKRTLGRRVVEKSINVFDVQLIEEVRRQGGLLKKYYNDTHGENKELTGEILLEMRETQKHIKDFYRDRLL